MLMCCPDQQLQSQHQIVSGHRQLGASTAAAARSLPAVSVSGMRCTDPCAAQHCDARDPALRHLCAVAIVTALLERPVPAVSVEETSTSAATYARLMACLAKTLAAVAGICTSRSAGPGAVMGRRLAGAHASAPRSDVTTADALAVEVARMQGVRGG